MARTTHNHKSAPKKEVTLLFLGMTGVGKSTLLASFRDFLNNVKFEDIQTTEKVNMGAGASQTQDVGKDRFYYGDYVVNIIDTPGLADTKGLETDKEHMEKIINFVASFGEFNAVCILVKRGENRTTHALRYGRFFYSSPN